MKELHVIFYKNIYVYSLKRGQSFCDVRGWWRQTAISTITTFLDHTMLCHLSSFASQPVVLNQNLAVSCCPATCWCSPWLTESLLATSWDWLKTDHITCGHLHISFHNTYHFCSTTRLLLIHTGVSCIEKSLMTWSWVNMQLLFKPGALCLICCHFE